MKIGKLRSEIEAFFALQQIEQWTLFLEQVRALQESFHGLERPSIPVGELVALKFWMQHWRQRVLALLLDSFSKNPTLEQAKSFFATLSILELKPACAELDRIAFWVECYPGDELKAVAARYFAQINEHARMRRMQGSPAGTLLELAGPERKLPILGNDPSRWSFEKWTGLEEFSRYQRAGAGVVYRGIEFEPGDVLVANINRDGNGVYTAMIEPRSYAYHIGMFAMISHQGRLFPSVIETYRVGVRAVPLSSFLRSEFNHYLEVYRQRAVSEGFHDRINDASSKLPAEAKGYNFDTEDPDHSYLACTTIANVLFAKARAPLISAKSRYSQDSQVQANLAQLDFVLPAFLSPSDFVVDPHLRLVGVVDGGSFRRNVTRELVERHFFEIFRNGTLQLDRFPMMFSLSRFGVRQMRSGSLLGRILGALFGFTQQNLPRGPEKVLAVVEIFEHAMAAAVKRADRWLWSPEGPAAGMAERGLFDIEALSRGKEVRRQMARALSSIGRLFR